MHILKWPGRITFINKKQKLVEGLTFGNRQNAVDAAGTGAESGVMK